MWWMILLLKCIVNVIYRSNSKGQTEISFKQNHDIYNVEHWLRAFRLLYKVTIESNKGQGHTVYINIVLPQPKVGYISVHIKDLLSLTTFEKPSG